MIKVLAEQFLDGPLSRFAENHLLAVSSHVRESKLCLSLFLKGH